MAGTLSARPAAGLLPPRDRPALLIMAGIALLLHVLALEAFSRWLQPRSQLATMAVPMYTRTIMAQAEPVAAPAPAPAVRARARRPRPQAAIRSAEADTGHSAPAPEPSPPTEAPVEGPAAPPQAAASAPDPAVAQAIDTAPPDPAPHDAAEAAANKPPPAADAHLDTWPRDTRLSYRLGGNYRGELHGSAEVLWQREENRYQVVVQMDIGFLLSSRFTSQGEIGPDGLQPAIYEEQVRKRRRTVRLGDDVQLDNGQRVPRPDGAQDAASQFIELSQRFATGRAPLEAGQAVRLWLARPGGVDEWTYDVVGEETLSLPRLGAVVAMHLKPRALARPRGPINAEIWFAPSLQYLPVRILITQGPEAFIDLLADTIEQR